MTNDTDPVVTSVPFNDLSRGAGSIDSDLVRTVERVVRSGWYLLGPETAAFESEFADWLGVTGVVCVGSGTDALEIALRSLDCSNGDEVIIPANAGGYATTACRIVGAVPVYCDVDSRTLVMEPATVVPLVTPRTRAVVATHLYGNVVDVDDLRASLPDGVAIVEDCAQAHGATLRGRAVGTLGDVAAFSFYPTKNLGALGDGGAIVSNDNELLIRVRSLRQYGWHDRYRAVDRGGRNSRIDEIQAAVLRQRLPHLESSNLQRDRIRDRYVDALHDRITFVESTGPDTRPVVHLCVIRSTGRDQLAEQLRMADIGVAIHYPIPDPDQPAWSGLPQRSGPLTNVRSACDQVLSLPCFPGMRDTEVDRVIEILDDLS